MEPDSEASKDIGIYALNADFTTALGKGTNAYASTSPLRVSGPWRMRVAAPAPVWITSC